MSDDGQVKLRLSKELKNMVEEQAKRNHRTLNGEIVFLLEQVIGNRNSYVKVIHLENGYKRLVYGSIINLIDVDYSNPNLTELKSDIDHCLTILKRSNSLKFKMMFFNKNIYIYEGGHHLDIVDEGKGSLGWLIIEDHWTEKVLKAHI